MKHFPMCVLLPWAILALSDRAKGADTTFQACEGIQDSRDCAIDEYCMTVGVDGDSVFCEYENHSNCFCLNYMVTCDSSTDCSFGEHCVRFLPEGTEAFCVRCQDVDKLFPTPIPVDTLHSCASLDAMPTPEGKHSRPRKLDAFGFSVKLFHNRFG